MMACERKRGSVYCGYGAWVSIPLGTPRNPLSDEELLECERLLEGADAEVPRALGYPKEQTL